jgi:hypothetical protein
LAERLLQESGGEPLALARMQILLPTRRAVRSLSERSYASATAGRCFCRACARSAISMPKS